MILLTRSITILLQRWNQDFYRAEEVSLDKGTSINVASTKHERKTQQGNISELTGTNRLKQHF